MKNRAGIDDHPLSREIDKVPYGRRYWLFVIIFIAELVLRRSFIIPLSIFILSYLGSLLVDEERRFEALYSIALVLYILTTI